MDESLYSQLTARALKARRLTIRALTARLLSVTAVILFTACPVTPAQANRTTAQDAAFVHMADLAELGALKLADLALHKSDDRRVVSFATRIRDVDSQLHLELRSIANAQHVLLRSTIDPSDGRQLDELALQSGSQFDMAYLKSQLRSDQRTLSVYNREVTNGDNKYVVAFAKETIPVLDQHISLARRGIASLAKPARR